MLQSRYISAKREFAVSALDDAVISRLDENWEEEGYDGMRVFLDEWADGLSLDTAQRVIDGFGIQEEVGNPEAYEHVDEVFYKIEDVLNNSVVQDINRKSELAQTGGPEYIAGRDGLKFGLIFEASIPDLEELRRKFSDRMESVEKFEEIAASTRVAFGPKYCAQKAVTLIKTVDFGHAPDYAINVLEQADDLLDSCGVSNRELKLAIRFFLTDRRKAQEYIYGNSSGSVEGALNQLMEIVSPGRSASLHKGGVMPLTARYISYRGALYVHVEQTQNVTAYYLPKDIKGVTTCKAKDVKNAKTDIWCVYDWKGRLRGRFKDKKDAVRHKVMMIRRFQGTDKAKRVKKYRPPND